MTDFVGQKVLVVGGSRGIGAAIVRSFASAGATVVFTYAGSTDAATTLTEQTNATAIHSDAADRDTLLATVHQAAPFDVFVYNAGLLVAGDPLTIKPDAVDRLIDVNVRGAYHASVEAARHLPEGGRILLMRVSVLMLLFFAVVPAALACQAPFAVSLVAFFIGGVSLPGFGVLWSMTLQRQIPTEILSRVSAYDTFGSVCLLPAGYVLAAPMASVLGNGGALWIAAGFSLLASCPLWCCWHPGAYGGWYRVDVARAPGARTIVRLLPPARSTRRTPPARVTRGP